jgi:hypothetical protein
MSRNTQFGLQLVRCNEDSGSTICRGDLVALKLYALTDPPCNWMSFFTTASPMPRPPSERSIVRRLC